MLTVHGLSFATTCYLFCATTFTIRMKSLLLGFLCVTFIVKFGISGKILGIIPTASYSHQVVFWPLWKELSLRGHEVTVITTDPMNDSQLINLTEINFHGAYKFGRDLNIFEILEKSIWTIVLEYFHIGTYVLDEMLSHPSVRNLIQDTTAHFDLVMIEAYHTAAYAFVPRFKCPLIILSSLDGSSFAYNQIGNPAHPILHPDYLTPFKNNLTFLERLRSLFTNVFFNWYYQNVYIPGEQELITKHFGHGYPKIQDIFKNYSMFFVNTNLLVHLIRPLLPNIISIGGGTHLMSPNLLPDNLQKILDNAKNGFIYFSLGSNVKSKHLANSTKREILETFRELPYTVLWKFENESLANIPNNVLISKWFPQQAIFQHPNIKLFITQGGLQSLEEAIFNHIPIIGIPVMADQIGNIASIVSKGLGVSIHYKDISSKALKSAILEVINNPRYQKKVKEMAEYIQDAPDTGLSKAIWWTEYVIRHKGAPHLRNPGLDLPLYQYYLLDIIAFLVGCALIAFCAIRLIFKLLRNMYNVIKFSLMNKQKKS